MTSNDGAPADLEAWDDDAIVKAFNHAMKTHRLEGEEEPYPSSEPSIGAWQPVETATPSHEHGAASVAVNAEAKEPVASVGGIPGPGSTAGGVGSTPAAAPVGGPNFGGYGAAAQQQSYYEPHRATPGSAPAIPPIPTGLDDEALNDLLLAWYYRYVLSLSF